MRADGTITSLIARTAVRAKMGGPTEVLSADVTVTTDDGKEVTLDGLPDPTGLRLGQRVSVDVEIRPN
jgi:hypothetical protein